MRSGSDAMTETKHLIRQAAHEIGITLNLARDSKLAIEAIDPETCKVSFVNRKGDDTTVGIGMDQDYKAIHEAMKKAWKGEV